MELGEKIATARKNKGITQQQLAESTNLTARTIQRIENGQSIPRAFTITAIAEALGATFQSLQPEAQVPIENEGPQMSREHQHFLQMFTLSCFSYVLIPLVHFLVPIYILKKATIKDGQTLTIARRTIRIQVIWAISTSLLMLAALAFNVISNLYFDRVLIINFLFPFFSMYALNAILLMRKFINIGQRYK